MDVRPTVQDSDILLLGSIRGEKYLEYLNDYQLLKKDYAAWNYFSFAASKFFSLP
jgi:hypothetical protein